ncbi:hypothetical protein WJX73_004904 [Symbiochloris irregularis]|uniref:Uncharacterized protein n=1 Tax=Symbiochloris irregularis TaxID=706552 RepID=A0AAW1NNB8_9CHLO
MLRVAQSLRLGAASHARCPSSFGLLTVEEHQFSPHHTSERALHAEAQPAEQLPHSRTTPKLCKSFKLHIGANLPLPTRGSVFVVPAHREARAVQPQEPVTAAAALMDYFEGMLAVPVVPSFLPITRWVANSKRMRGTLVAQEDRQKARLSWYHPDDTMVPRDWFKGGLLADLKYYRPFGGAAPS